VFGGRCSHEAGRCLISFLVVSGQPSRRCSLVVRADPKELLADAGCHAAIDCVASVFPFTSTARKRMLLPVTRSNGPE